ncbi:winged helix-turn-helix transcriptional regulator [Mitsuaria sp. TWR114]|jgi:DNA-binding MarR family transcriptional regulator|uniref:MarR family winged helix-turn-helix transcriptional regulator n=1 Tax=unclassified Roseateles TaxID=2626991 RepID=UPI0008DFBF39|nr:MULTISPECIES: MarR family winged helix-turn-helix transcriptional regulator [unclassified Roseateles]MBB3281055.1 DNA-binding MarR family transcriptional regulator [Mitsuaria sp. BK037]TXD77961.1 winged helix-turn-helix transcriptional regulator [Mitsuaria sp. TWR114]SFR79334.1 DNA-binding transcriptional regulator, MarR family [Mitsuaria sp. PDC51]
MNASVTATKTSATASTAQAEPISPKGCTNFKLRQVTRLVSNHCEAHFAETGLKTTQYALLSHIVVLGPIQPSELARRMDLDLSTLSRNIQPLLAMGLVETLPGPDARSRQLQATEEGHARRKQMKATWKRAQLSLNERLGDERVQRLHALLDECAALMRGEVDPDELDGDSP